MTKTQNRDANHLRWQKSTSLGIRVPRPEYRKMEHRETFLLCVRLILFFYSMSSLHFYLHVISFCVNAERF